MSIKPKYPIYIVSKGRYDKRMTADSLEMMNQPYFMVIEQKEYEMYAEKIGAMKCLALPQEYLDKYKLCDADGLTRSGGPGAARNFCLDHAKQLNVKRHWVLDDNINGFYRLNKNLKVKCLTSSIFRAAEDFVDRYDNVPIAGFNYAMFAKRKDSAPPFVLNTRIYSCLLIDNNIKHRWEGRYNEDTHLSLRVLKDNDCTIQFNAFLANKVKTQTMSGGNTDAFYAIEGTLNKSKMIEELHPDVAKVVFKFNRWHHHVDYSRFKNNRLIKIVDTSNMPKVNNYGMMLTESNIKFGD